jgi:GNAT superfamily N-acetyltransferase
MVARDRVQIAGWCRLFPLSSCDGPAPEAELGIGLLPFYRGRGIGKALVGQAVGWAWKARITHLVLTTKRNNHRAVRLFERFGFVAADSGEDGTMKMIAEL